MSERADVLMLTGIEWPCPDCGQGQIFVAPEGCEEGSAGCDFCCTQCGAALLINPFLLTDTVGRVAPAVLAAHG
jgi:uncharacterized protein (DUF983 family)